MFNSLSSLLLRSILECEKLVKATYKRNGLVYRESSSEDEGVGGGVLSSEVIEIDDDEDDDVIAVGCRELCHFITRTIHPCHNMKTKQLLKICFCSFHCLSGSSKEARGSWQGSSGENNILCHLVFVVGWFDGEFRCV